MIPLPIKSLSTGKNKIFVEEKLWLDKEKIFTTRSIWKKLGEKPLAKKPVSSNRNAELA